MRVGINEECCIGKTSQPYFFGGLRIDLVFGIIECMTQMFMYVSNHTSIPVICTPV